MGQRIDDGVIEFFYTTDEYGCFSNFYMRPIEYKGKIWPSTEHAYQAQKTGDPALQEKIRKARTPKQAATMGRNKSLKLVPNWDTLKHVVMAEVVLAKFTQHQDLQDVLLSTGTRKLVETSPYDAYWGCGRDGKGANMLGRILMAVRKKLSQPKKDTVL